MEEEAYKAFWVSYGFKYAIFVAITIIVASIIHAVTTSVISRIWPVGCSCRHVNKVGYSNEPRT